MSVLLKDAAGQTIYACVGVMWDVKSLSWVYTETVFVSASNQASARYQFQSRFRGHNVKEVAIAPAVGSQVLDNHGDRLLVT